MLLHDVCVNVCVVELCLAVDVCSPVHLGNRERLGGESREVRVVVDGGGRRALWRSVACIVGLSIFAKTLVHDNVEIPEDRRMEQLQVVAV